MLNIPEYNQLSYGKYNRFETKYARCRKIEELLKQKRFRCSELAKLFGVHKSTISRNIDDMSCIVGIIQDDDGRFYIED